MEREAPSSFTESIRPPAFPVSPHAPPKTSRQPPHPDSLSLSWHPDLLSLAVSLLSAQVFHRTVLATPPVVIRCTACLYPTDKPFEGHADSSRFRHPLTQHQDRPCSSLSWHDSHLLLKCLHSVKSDEPAPTVIVPSAGNGVALLTTGFRNPRLRALGDTVGPPRPSPRLLLSLHPHSSAMASYSQSFYSHLQTPPPS